MNSVYDPLQVGSFVWLVILGKVGQRTLGGREYARPCQGMPKLGAILIGQSGNSGGCGRPGVAVVPPVKEASGAIGAIYQGIAVKSAKAF
jgi:hypothetical protein